MGRSALKRSTATGNFANPGLDTILPSRLQERAMTSVSTVEIHSPVGNPIDLVEEIVLANDWSHDRASEEEMVVEISGRWCDYRMYFLWQEELSALHFSCGFDMTVSKRRCGPLYELMALAIERLWLGHFDLAAGEASPSRSEERRVGNGWGTGAS